MTPRRRLLSALVGYISGTSSADSLSQAAGEVVAYEADPPESVVAVAAATTPTSYGELGALTHAAGRDLGYPELNPTFRSLVRAVDLAREIAAGNAPAGPGANELWEVGRETADGAERFGVFAELADEWETNLSRRAETEDEIRVAAAKLVAEVALRRLD